MSRAFTPPDTLSDEDVRTVADVRRAVWINGIFGMGAGLVAGASGHVVLNTLQRRFVGDAGEAGASAAASPEKARGLMYRSLRLLPPLGKNTFMLSVLGGGALGSFVMSTTAGKNAVHLLHPIFNVGRDETAGKSPYQVVMSKAAADDGEDELDAAHHRTRSLQRKASIKRRLETGQSLSGSHSDTWPETPQETEEMQRDRAMHRAEAWGQRQTNRRKTIKDRIEKGHALSDSTGGHWSDDGGDGK